MKTLNEVLLAEIEDNRAYAQRIYKEDMAAGMDIQKIYERQSLVLSYINGLEFALTALNLGIE